MFDDRDPGRPILHDDPQPEPDLATGDSLVVCSNLRYCIRSVLVRLSNQPQHHDTGDEQYYTANDDKRQAALERGAHRRPIALQQYCKQQVTSAPRDDTGKHETADVEPECTTRDSDQLERDRGKPPCDNDPGSPGGEARPK
jgi:hypothetical protein